MQAKDTTGGVIYCFRNKVNGKEYIGKTSLALGLRVTRHFVNAKKPTPNSIFHRALAAHGRESFEITIIDRAETREELDRLERHHIKVRNSISPHGYNLTEGGTGGNPGPDAIRRMADKIRGRKQSPEAIARRVAANTGKKRTKEACARISEGNKGVPRPSLRGVPHGPHSAETRAKLIAAQSGISNLALKGKPSPLKGIKRTKKEWIVTFPDGHEEGHHSLRRFCKDRNLNYSSMKDLLHSTTDRDYDGYRLRWVAIIKGTQMKLW